MRLLLQILPILTCFFVSSASAKSCESWFMESGLEADSADCELSCAVLPVDMGTFTCAQNCEKYCRLKNDDCRNPPPRQCGFYRSCVEAKYKCGKDGYPIRYGEKYCQRFATLTNADLTEKGIKWRNSTMLCLQKELSNLLYTSNNIETCSDLNMFAFASHAACYTQKNNSICDLSTSEMAAIGSTVDVGDIMTEDGMSQVVQVLKTCIGYVEAQIHTIRSREKMTALLYYRSNIQDQTNTHLLELEEKRRYLYELK